GPQRGWSGADLDRSLRRQRRGVAVPRGDLPTRLGPRQQRRGRGADAGLRAQSQLRRGRRPRAPLALPEPDRAWDFNLDNRARRISSSRLTTRPRGEFTVRIESLNPRPPVRARRWARRNCPMRKKLGIAALLTAFASLMAPAMASASKVSELSETLE